MSIISIVLDFFPDDLKQELLNGIVDFVAGQAKKLLGDEVAKKISTLSSQEAFNKTFDQAMKRAISDLATSMGYRMKIWWQLLLPITQFGHRNLYNTG